MKDAAFSYLMSYLCTKNNECEQFSILGDGISSYVTNPPGAGESLRECLEIAMATVPASQQRITPAYLGATAGMRLLRSETLPYLS